MQRADYEQAVEAARRWIADHRRYPKQQEWEQRAPGRPTTRTIKRRWGWEELMRAAAAPLAAGGAPVERQLALSCELHAPGAGDDSQPIALRDLGEGGTVSAQARQLFAGLWEVVRARGLHELAPELWPEMLVDKYGHGKGLPLNRRGGELYGADAIAGDVLI